MSPSRSGNTHGYATGVLPYRPDLKSHPRSKFSKCHVCRLPSILHELQNVRSKKGNVELASVPSQGPESQPNIKRWCAGSCMAIIAVMASAYMDLDASSANLTHPESKKFWTFVKKKFHWLVKEVRLDLKIRGKNRDFTGVR
jgi:hypothetical protein